MQTRTPTRTGEPSTFQGPSGTKRSAKGWFLDTGWRHVVALAVVTFALFPLIWVLSAAFSGGGLSSQDLVPDEVTLDNYRALTSDSGHPPFWRWMFNSLLVGGITAVTTVFLCALAAYAFSRLRFKGRRPGMLFLLLVQMFPNLLVVLHNGHTNAHGGLTFPCPESGRKMFSSVPLSDRDWISKRPPNPSIRLRMLLKPL